MFFSSLNFNLLLLLVVVLYTVTTATTLYLDPTQTIPDRVASLLSQLSTPEKISQTIVRFFFLYSNIASLPHLLSPPFLSRRLLKSYKHVTSAKSVVLVATKNYIQEVMLLHVIYFKKKHSRLNTTHTTSLSTFGMKVTTVDVRVELSFLCLLI